MKKLLLAGVAALSVLSASAAHTTPFYKWQCGKYTVILHAVSPGAPESERWSSLTVKPHWPKPFGVVHFKWDAMGMKQVDDDEEDFATYTGGKASLNGKRCKDYVYKPNPCGPPKRVGDPEECDN
jgi:hypothetical protein